MADNRNSCFCGSDRGREKDMVCIDTYRVLDSCRDKDCFEDVRVYLTCYGQEIIDKTTVVRAKCAKVLWSYIDIDTVPFNRGFYQLSIRIYIKIICEACLGPGNLQELDGVAIVEKKVILFGSEGNVSIFKSESQNNGFCSSKCGGNSVKSNNLPIAVLETVDPIILNSRVVEPTQHCCCSCCCSVDEVPDCVCCSVSGDLADDKNSNKLTVSLGLFSVVRIERPAQYLINAVEYCVPEKECTAPVEDDPCCLFRNMSFPIKEFCPPASSVLNKCDDIRPGRCGCE
ncbi:MAG: hypothetical protein HFE30_04250 [Clostridiales bacterium]|nr:hypothetical protein [Clostridiales bacterium]